MATESERISSIHKYISNDVLVWKIHDSYHRGIADAYYSGKKQDLWIEYKSQIMTKKRRLTPRLSSLQRVWLRRQYELGRQVWVIILTDVGHYLLKTPEEWERGPLPWDPCVTKYRHVAEAIEEHVHG